MKLTILLSIAALLCAFRIAYSTANFRISMGSCLIPGGSKRLDRPKCQKECWNCGFQVSYCNITGNCDCSNFVGHGNPGQVWSECTQKSKVPEPPGKATTAVPADLRVVVSNCITRNGIHVVDNSKCKQDCWNCGFQDGYCLMIGDCDCWSFVGHGNSSQEWAKCPLKHNVPIQPAEPVPTDLRIYVRSCLIPGGLNSLDSSKCKKDCWNCGFQDSYCNILGDCDCTNFVGHGNPGQVWSECTQKSKVPEPIPIPQRVEKPGKGKPVVPTTQKVQNTAKGKTVVPTTQKVQKSAKEN